ncbi:MAG: ATP-binding protein [Hyphomicrobiales bacterium]|nr:ATP-binding protein [Hyphomicrobiales bacterium]
MNTADHEVARRPHRLKAYVVWLRRRLSSRPDSEHEMMFNRLAIVLVAMCYLAIAAQYGSDGASSALRHGLVLCSLYWLASAFLMVDILVRPGVSHGRRGVALVLDMSVLSMGMHLGDSAFALGYPIYLWIIFGNGFRFGVRYLAASALAAVIGFAWVIAHTNIWQRDIDLSIGLMIGLVLLPAYVAALIRKLSEAKRQAEDANRAKSMFLASISHELRTPLNAIITLSDLLGATQTQREPREMVQTIATSGRSLLKLINNILDLSRIESGRSVHARNDFALFDLLAQLRRVLVVQARAKNISLGIWIGPRVPNRVQGAELDFEEVLMNLVGNAIKFTSKGGVFVHVDLDEAAEVQGRLRVSVRDTGIGIAPDAQDRIFESFVQADASIIDRFGGTGLGLSIVRQLVERNGGSISVSSRPGEGSTFSFTFDLVALAQALPEPGTSWPAIVLTRNLSLEAQLRFHGVNSTRVGTLPALRDALTHWDYAAARPTLIIDVDTLAARERETIDIWGWSTLAHAVTGVLSAGVPGLPLMPHLPLAMALSHPLSESELQRLAVLGKPFRSTAPAVDPTVAVRPIRILVAEDNVTNQKVIGKLLSRGGHTVTIVDNGEQAVEALTKGDFDLVLMDINMPVTNGLDATKLHRFASLGQPRIPIYALTADVTPETRAACEEAGMDGCLHKPIEQAELRAALITAAGRGRANAGAAVPLSGAASSATGAEPGVAAGIPDINPLEIALVDDVTLGNLCELGGAGFVADLVAQFTSDALGQIDALRQSVQEIDAAGFRDIAHSLRSAAANVGARRMFAVCLDWRNATTEEIVEQGDARLALLMTILEDTQVAMDARIAMMTADEAAALKRPV